ncbi:hypothetical protein Fmac_008085 [Flemingia macrophylla]|uniref:Pentatricopeptide repeat-containing protein n=1 Tax=Flemingia macrophylla TaxID=520843 RepID=A0ABD1MYT5_9FABA
MEEALPQMKLKRRIFIEKIFIVMFKACDMARSIKLVDNMLLKGCVPNEMPYNALVHGLCLKGKLEQAISGATDLGIGRSWCLWKDKK